jgi:hypothetical protein
MPVIPVAGGVKNIPLLSEKPRFLADLSDFCGNARKQKLRKVCS